MRGASATGAHGVPENDHAGHQVLTDAASLRPGCRHVGEDCGDRCLALGTTETTGQEDGDDVGKIEDLVEPVEEKITAVPLRAASRTRLWISAPADVDAARRLSSASNAVPRAVAPDREDLLLVPLGLGAEPSLSMGTAAMVQGSRRPLNRRRTGLRDGSVVGA